MNSQYIPIETQSIKSVAHLCAMNKPDNLTIHSAAMEVITDFSRIKPLLIPDNVLHAALKEIFLDTNSDYALVEDKHHDIIGLLTPEDIIGQRSMIRAYEYRHPLSEQTARDLMTPLKEVPAISFAAANHARLGDVVSTMRRSVSKFLLVTEVGRDTLHGIFNLDKINEWLPLAPLPPLHARSVAEIAQAINGHFKD